MLEQLAQEKLCTTCYMMVSAWSSLVWEIMQYIASTKYVWMLWKCSNIHNKLAIATSLSSSKGSSLLATLVAEVPDRVKSIQQFNRWKEEKKRLSRTAEREEELLMKYTGMYKSTKFKICASGWSNACYQSADRGFWSRWFSIPRNIPESDALEVIWYIN